MDHSNDKPMAGWMIVKKAKEMPSKMNVAESCAFFDDWLNKFKNCHVKRELTFVDEKSSANTTAEKFTETFSELVAKHKLTAEQKHNADETGFSWRMLPSSIFSHSRETETGGHKQSKESLTFF